MPKKLVVALLLLAAAGAAGYAYLDRGNRPNHYTGFVEGEDRVLRSEVTGRVLEVIFGEGDSVPANAVVARLDERDIRTSDGGAGAADRRARCTDRPAAAADPAHRADVEAGRQRASRRAAPGRGGGAAGRADVRAREVLSPPPAPARSRASTRSRSERDQASSAVDRARDLLARAEAEAGSVDVARHQLEVLRQQRELAAAQLAELKVTQSKYVIRAPAVPTVVQTQFIWPGELAQPGTAILAVLDPGRQVRPDLRAGRRRRPPASRASASRSSSTAEPGQRVPAR